MNVAPRAEREGKKLCCFPKCSKVLNLTLVAASLVTTDSTSALWRPGGFSAYSWTQLSDGFFSGISPLASEYEYRVQPKMKMQKDKEGGEFDELRRINDPLMEMRWVS